MTFAPSYAQSLILNPSNRTVEKLEETVRLAMRDSLSGTDNSSQYLIELEQSSGERGLSGLVVTYLRIYQGRFLPPIFVEPVNVRNMLVSTIESSDRHEPIILTKKVRFKDIKGNSQVLTNDEGDRKTEYVRLYDTSLLDFGRKTKITTENLRRAISDKIVWSALSFDFLHDRLRTSFKVWQKNSLTDHNGGIPT